MSAALVAVSLLLVLLLCYAAARKLTHRREVVASYARVGVAEARLNLLAALLLAGAAGLLLGLRWPPIGVAAAACLELYFLLAIAAHVRARDTANLPTPVAMALLAAAALVLRVITS